MLSVSLSVKWGLTTNLPSILSSFFLPSLIEVPVCADSELGTGNGTGEEEQRGKIGRGQGWRDHGQRVQVE